MIIIISQTITDLCVSRYEVWTLYFKISVRPQQISLRVLAESGITGVVEACNWIAPGSHIRPVILSKPTKQTGSSKKQIQDGHAGERDKKRFSDITLLLPSLCQVRLQGSDTRVDCKRKEER